MLTTTSTLRGHENEKEKGKEREKRPLTPDAEPEQMRTVVLISMPFEVHARKRWSVRTAVAGAETALPHLEFGVAALPARGLAPVLEAYAAEERARAEAEAAERARVDQALPSPGLAPVRSRIAEFVSSRVHLPVLTEVASRGVS